jgi:DNA polymerase III epsilon subunit-like protein
MAKRAKKKSKGKKPRGSFDFILAVDCETTGIHLNSDDSSEGHQAISWGLIVADAATFKPIEELYVEVKWNDDMKALRAANPEFGKGAEKIHGLTMDYLEKNGLSEEEAVSKIASLILKYWGPRHSPRLLGHNVHLFDYKFLINALRRCGIEIPKANRHVDTSSIGYATVGAFTSDSLFETMGFEKRGDHNALDDARMSLQTCALIRTLWDQKVGLKAQ